MKKSPPDSLSTSRLDRCDMLLLPGLIALTLIFYRHALDFGFNSDAFVLLKNAIDNPLQWDHSYHYMPVTASWLWLQYQLFGLHEAAYEVLNIIQHGILGWLVFLLGLRLGLKRIPAVIGAVLFITAGSAYQVVLWSVVGSNYFVSGVIYLSAMLLCISIVDSGKQRRMWIVTLLYALALLAHEQSLSLLPLCFLYVLLMSGGSGPEQPFKRLLHRASYPWALRMVSPMMIPLLGFLGMKYFMSFHANVRGGWYGASVFLRKTVTGLFSTLTFRGDSTSMNWIVDAFGTGPGVFIWLIPLGFLVTLLIFKGRPIEIFLGFWFLGQVLMMGVAIPVSPRHLYLPTVPMSLLTASVACRLLAAVLGWFNRRPRFSALRQENAPHLFGVLAVFLFIMPAAGDIRNAEKYWEKADVATKSLEKALFELAENHPAVSTVMFLDAGKYVYSPGFEIYSFQNGLQHMVGLLTPDRFDRALIHHMIESSNVANGSQPITAESLEKAMRKKGLGVLEFKPDLMGFRILDHAEVERVVLFTRSGNAVYSSAETRPDLTWHQGPLRYLEIPPGKQVISTTYSPETAGTWMFACFEDRQDLKMRMGIRWKATVGIRGRVDTAWRHKIQKVTDLSASTLFKFFVRNTGEKPLKIARFGFLPLRHTYSIRTSPELWWNDQRALEIPSGSFLALPLAACDGGDCVLSIRFLNLPGHEVELRLPDEDARTFTGSSSGGRKWRTETLQRGSWEAGAITIRACGHKPAMIRYLQCMHGETDIDPNRPKDWKD